MALDLSSVPQQVQDALSKALSSKAAADAAEGAAQQSQAALTAATSDAAAKGQASVSAAGQLDADRKALEAVLDSYLQPAKPQQPVAAAPVAAQPAAK